MRMNHEMTKEVTDNVVTSKISVNFSHRVTIKLGIRLTPSSLFQRIRLFFGKHPTDFAGGAIFVGGQPVIPVSEFVTKKVKGKVLAEAVVTLVGPVGKIKDATMFEDESFDATVNISTWVDIAKDWKCNVFVEEILQ